MLVELVKSVGLTILSPILVTFMTISIAKFHFEKDIKTKYLMAKDKTATDVLSSLCSMLTCMWDLVNINARIQREPDLENNPDVMRQKQDACAGFYTAVRNSYSQLGLMGLYYGTAIVDSISQLQSNLNEMVNNNDFSKFEDWDEFRRNELLPVLQSVCVDLKSTVFEKTKSFRLILD